LFRGSQEFECFLGCAQGPADHSIWRADLEGTDFGM
jgi:hypothetical protein